MVSSTLLLFGLASIFLYVTPCVSNICCEQELSYTESYTEKPFEIILGNSKTRMVFCGGTLITNYYVLTAADCVINRQPDEIDAFTSVKYLSMRYDRFKLRSVDEIIVHDSYDSRDPWRNNIALLRLGRLILTHTCVFDSWVNKAIVPQKYELNKLIRQELLLVRLSGFGISENQPPESDELVESFTYIVDWEYCRKLYQKIQYNISDTHICVYDPDIIMNPKEYRTSDVGSSLIFKKNLILGIALNVSEDFYSEMYHYPILFTNVSCYYDWIQRIIGRYDENDLKIKIFQTWKTSPLLFR